MMMRFTCFLIISFPATIFTGNMLAQESGQDPETTYGTEAGNPHQFRAPDSLETTQAYRQADLAVRKFDDARWKEIVGEQNYNEKPFIKPEFDFPSISWAGPIVKIIAYGLVIALVSAAIWYIVKNITFDVKVEREDFQNEDLEKPPDNLEVLDIEGLLDQAKRESNFRMAVRLYYLGLLKRLNSLGKISWKKDKTNRDYLSELFSVGFYYAEIQELTLSYEEVWYGDHALKDEAYKRLEGSFENVYQRIHTVKTS